MNEKDEEDFAELRPDGSIKTFKVKKHPTFYGKRPAINKGEE